MPANKNAVIRYMYLDQMLSDRHHYYSRTDLCNKCNERLVRDGYSEVSKRTIELDLIDMGLPPFNMDIDDSLVMGGKHIIRYSDQTVSLFSKPLSDDEKKLLREALSTMGQFSGLDNFEWIANLQEKLDDETRERIFTDISGLSVSSLTNHDKHLTVTQLYRAKPCTGACDP